MKSIQIKQLTFLIDFNSNGVCECTCSFWISKMEGGKTFKGELENENFRGVQRQK